MPTEIFTDGACRGNPGPGGWGVLLRHGTIEKELFGGELETTNNRMEMTAVIRALEALIKPAKVTITTDSQYVMKGVTEWMSQWKRRGWRAAEGRPLKNVDLWQRLDELLQRHDVEWHWVKGHNGHAENERVDALANRGADQVLEVKGR